MRSAAGVAIVVALVTVSACPTPETRDADVVTPDPAVTAPDTTADALQAHLQQARYATQWQHWPAREPFYTGQEPHGALLRTYLNRTAHDALQRGDATMPAGSIIVKESYTQGRELINTTVMHKATGFAPDAGDWFWMVIEPDGSAGPSGRVAMCRDCHAAGRDYILTPTQ
jgi:hypothetical protein